VKPPSSGKSPRLKREGVYTMSVRVQRVCEEYGIACAAEYRDKQAGRPAILRMQALDAELATDGGTAVLTVYATGSWTWGGDADAVAHCREPLDRAEVLA